jgi:hypothetical protein
MPCFYLGITINNKGNKMARKEISRFAVLYDFESNRNGDNRRVVTLQKERVGRDDEDPADFKVDAEKLGAWVASFYGEDKRVIRYDQLGDAIKAAQFELVKPSAYYVHEQQKIMRKLGVTEDTRSLPVDTSDFESHREYVSVVPIDDGEFTYREIGQEVRFSRPIATFVKLGKGIMVSGNYDVDRMKQTLEDTVQRDNHWLPESLCR